MYHITINLQKRRRPLVLSSHKISFPNYFLKPVARILLPQKWMYWMYFSSRLLPVKENFLSRQIFKVVNIILILSATDRASTSNFWFILIFAGKWNVDKGWYCKSVQFIWQGKKSFLIILLCISIIYFKCNIIYVISNQCQAPGKVRSIWLTLQLTQWLKVDKILSAKMILFKSCQIDWNQKLASFP